MDENDRTHGGKFQIHVNSVDPTVPGLISGCSRSDVSNSHVRSLAERTYVDQNKPVCSTPYGVPDP